MLAKASLSSFVTVTNRISLLLLGTVAVEDSLHKALNVVVGMVAACEFGRDTWSVVA